MFSSIFPSLWRNYYNILSLIYLFVPLTTLSSTLRINTGTHLRTLKTIAAPHLVLSLPASCLLSQCSRPTILHSLPTCPPSTPGFSSKKFLTTKQSLLRTSLPCTKTKYHQLCILSTSVLLYFKYYSQSAHTFKALAENIRSADTAILAWRTGKEGKNMLRRV